MQKVGVHRIKMAIGRNNFIDNVVLLTFASFSK